MVKHAIIVHKFFARTYYIDVGEIQPVQTKH